MTTDDDDGAYIRLSYTAFREEGAVCVIAAFSTDAAWRLLARMQMRRELATRVQRPIDLISKYALERRASWLRREVIPDTARVIVPTDEAGHALQ